MTTTRRLLFQAAALLPFSKARAARKTNSVYAQLGIRPVINLAGTQTIYGASKAALDSFTRGIAKELAPTIRVNAVAPGVIVTPFHEKVSTPEQLEAWKEANPLKKNGHAGHIAEAIRFLIENDFINGETIDINGGLFMR